jgi:hypothetical protein
LTGKLFEASLVEVAGAGSVVVGMIALGVGLGEAVHEVAELVLRSRPDDEVPVIGHEAIGEEAYRDAGVCFGEDAFEGVIVLVFMEQGPAADAAVEDVIEQASRRIAGSTRHGVRLRWRRGWVKELNHVPFCRP